jgi:Trk K+ transport system NAD-binding subunit
MTTAIIGVGQMRSALVHHLVRGGERVVLAAQDEAKAEALKAGPEQD